MALQAELVDEAGAASDADHSQTVDLEGFGSVTIGITHAHGKKCQRCWNWSTAGDSVHFAADKKLALGKFSVLMIGAFAEDIMYC